MLLLYRRTFLYYPERLFTSGALAAGCWCKQTRMSSGLQLELQTLHSCIDEIDADRAREIVANISQICLSDVTQRNIGCSHGW